LVLRNTEVLTEGDVFHLALLFSLCGHFLLINTWMDRWIDGWMDGWMVISSLSARGDVEFSIVYLQSAINVFT